MAPAINRTLTVLAVAGVGILAYAVYFDHKRRTDAKFRKQLRREKKKIDKSVAQETTSSSTSGDAALPTAEILAVMALVKDDRVPTTPEERENYFMSQVEKGEQLCAKGPNFAVEAALAFFRALRVYPSPVELIMIFQNTVPEPIFKIVLEMMRLDVKGRVEGYYEVFPPKRMNVSTKAVEVTDSSGGKVLKRILVADKDFTAGEVIYNEEPIVSVLDPDLEGKGSHCSRCLRQIDEGTALKPDGDRLASAFCSKECEAKLKAESQSLLFGPEYAIPIELNPTQDLGDAKKREDAQIAFARFVRESGRIHATLVARFIARQVINETVKLLPPGHRSIPTPSQADEWTENGYTLFDHVERVRYLELSGKESEAEHLRAILKANLHGLEDFVTDERYTVLVGKMAYNAYGISPAGGRDDKPPPKERPEGVELMRTPNGTAHQVGAGFFAVSSYISHSCDPCARPSFESANSEMRLVVTRDIKVGDEITVSYVDASVHEDEDVIQARYRRRKELARGWRFACQCDRCVREAPSPSAAGEKELQLTDESKVEPIVSQVDQEAAAQGKGQRLDAETTATVD
ncbi:MAS20-domain-containing protein [Russula compacta]|nr:MAS20-domain-containing protein [Russula compacta]